MIVGFPTEDERGVRADPRAVDAAGITRVHTFSYSPRPGTAAEAMGDAVPVDEKKRRSQASAAAPRSARDHHRTGKLGRSERVLIDKLAEAQCSGYTADYTRCYLPAGAGARGAIVAAQCAELHADGIRCRIPCAAPLSSAG